MTKPLGLSIRTVGAILALSIGTVAATLAVMGGTAYAANNCSLVASPSGSDEANGSLSAPFRTAQKLVDTLAPGQFGCLEAGTYNEDVTFSHGGAAGAPVRLTSYPGQSATLSGRLWVKHGSDYVTVSRLNLIGANSDNLPSPTLNGDHATFTYDTVTNNHTAICFVVGSDWGSATNTVISHDVIHDCGVMPAANHDHGIYVADAVNTRIVWNEIYDNADRGVQLYPDAQNTIVAHNVIDGNGEGVLFSGDYGTASDNANVYANLITGSVIRHDVESYYPDGNRTGHGNALHNNCIWRAAESPVDTSSGGFSSTSNRIANPEYVNAAAHDYRLQPGSPCLTLVGNVAAAVPGAPASTPIVAGAARSLKRVALSRKSRHSSGRIRRARHRRSPRSRTRHAPKHTTRSHGATANAPRST
jgi:parallel beta-helix repeat protein